MATILKSRLGAPSEGKPERAASATTGLAGFNLNDFAELGRRQLDDTRDAAAALVADAQAQADSIRQRAHQEGYKIGIEKASTDNEAKIKAAGDKRAQEQLAAIRSAVEQLHRVHEDWMSQYAESLTSIALLAAERIVRGKLESEKTILVRWAAEALESTRSASKLTVAVHPEMLAELGSALDDLVALPTFPTNTHVVPDETLDVSSIVVRQDGGEIQAGLRAQLDRLTEMLG